MKYIYKSLRHAKRLILTTNDCCQLFYEGTSLIADPFLFYCQPLFFILQHLTYSLPLWMMQDFKVEINDEIIMLLPITWQRLIIIPLVVEATTIPQLSMPQTHHKQNTRDIIQLSRINTAQKELSYLLWEICIAAQWWVLENFKMWGLQRSLD